MSNWLGIKRFCSSVAQTLRTLAISAVGFATNNVKLLCGVAAAALIAGVMLGDLYTNAIVLEPIDVSPNISMAVTSAAVTEQFYAELRDLRRHTETAFTADRALIDPSPLAEIRVKAGPFDTTLQAILDSVRFVLRRPRSKVMGTISPSDKSNEFRLLLFPPNNDPIECRVKSDLSSGFRECAELLSEVIDPYATAAYYFQHRKWDRAEKLAQRIVSSSRAEDLTWGHNMLGQLDERRRDTSAAMQEYNKAIQASPCFAPAYVNMGNVSENAGDTAKAESLYYNALKCDPKSPTVLTHLGILRMLQQRYPEAESLFRKAQQLNPSFALSYSELGALDARRDDLDSAEANFERAEQLSESKSAPYEIWGNAYTSQKNYLAAAVRYRMAVNADQTDTEAWLLLASTEFLSSDYVDAKRDAIKCIPDLLAPELVQHPVEQRQLVPLFAVDGIIRPYDFDVDMDCVKVYRTASVFATQRQTDQPRRFRE